MRAGGLDRQIRIERSTLAVSAAGFSSLTWFRLDDLPATVKGLSGDESLKAGREITGEVNKFFIRYYEGITSKDRVVYEGRNWDILNVREIGRRDGMEITAQVQE